MAEWLAAATVVFALYHDWDFVRHAGYLPPPFMYDVFDTFMDWFNTVDYAVNPGAYDVWRSIYPPISFVFLKVFSVHSCYIIGPEIARDCDWVGRLTLFSFYLLDVLIIARSFFKRDPETAIPRTVAMVRGIAVSRSFFKRDPETAIPRTVAMALGLPLLFTLDRGNLVMVCFTAFALGTGPLVRSARLRQLCLAVAINFKPYLIASLAGPGLTRRWRAVEGVLLATVGVYALSWGIFGSGDPVTVLHNMLGFQENRLGSVYGPMFYGTSYVSALNALHSQLPLMRFLGSKSIEGAEFLLPILVRVGQLSVVVAFATAAYKAKPGWWRTVSALGVSLALTTVEVGGYSECFILFLVFLERRTDAWRALAIALAYALSIPFDRILVHISHEINTAYITNRAVGYDLGVTLGMVLRPLLLIGVQFALAMSVIRHSLLPSVQTLSLGRTATPA